VDDAAVNLSKEMARSKHLARVGFLGGNESRRGLTLNGIAILGTLDELPTGQSDSIIQQAIIAMPNASHKQRKHAIDLCNQGRR